MRTSLLALGAALSISLTACGSSTDTSSSPTPTVAVESQSASGAVASAEECPANSPVRGLLRGDLDGDDGVFGHVYNRTASTLWVWSQSRDATAPCRLLPGQGASFASTSVELDSPDAPWVPRRGEPSEVDLSPKGRYWILVTESSEAAASGVALGVRDPQIGRPTAVSIHRSPGGATCASDNVALSTGGLREDQEYRLKGNSQGSVLVKRLKDSRSIAQEWIGREDDWARIDLSVESIGRC